MPGWNDRRLARRVRPGDGRTLTPFRWWQTGSRSVLSVSLPAAGRPVELTVEVSHLGDAYSGVVSAGLYTDGRRSAESRLPAVFPVSGGRVEVRKGRAGLRRCRFVGDDGTTRSLVPHPKSAEGRRLRLERDHPRASRTLAVSSSVMLLVGVVVNLLHLWGPISAIPPVAVALGSVTPPFAPPVWLSLTLGVGAALAVVERATHMRYHWLLDVSGT